MKTLLKDESRLFQQGSLMILGTLVGAACNAGFHMVVGRILPGAEYGTLGAMLGIILVATTPLMALQNTVAHYASLFIQQDRRADVMPMFNYWFRLLLLLGMLLFGGAFFFRSSLSTFWQGIDPAIIVLTFLVLAISMFMNLTNGVLQGVQAFTWLAWVPQTWGAVRLVLGGVLTYFIAAKAIYAIAAQGMGVLVMLSLSACAFCMLGFSWTTRTLRPEGIRRYMGASLLCLLGYAILMNLDVALAKHYFDEDIVGIFAKAATIARTAVFLPLPVVTVLFPKVSSTGGISAGSWGLLLRAIFFAGVLVLCAVGVCVLLPQLPWWVLYGGLPSHPQAILLTRLMALAMGPLALAYILLNFEMAQRRFHCGHVMLPCALGYVLGVYFFHAQPWHLAAMLGTMNVLACVVLLCGVLWQHRELRNA